MCSLPLSSAREVLVHFCKCQLFTTAHFDNSFNSWPSKLNHHGIALMVTKNEKGSWTSFLNSLPVTMLQVKVCNLFANNKKNFQHKTQWSPTQTINKSENFVNLCCTHDCISRIHPFQTLTTKKNYTHCIWIHNHIQKLGNREHSLTLKNSWH